MWECEKSIEQEESPHSRRSSPPPHSPNLPLRLYDRPSRLIIMPLNHCRSIWKIGCFPDSRHRLSIPLLSTFLPLLHFLSLPIHNMLSSRFGYAARQASRAASQRQLFKQSTVASKRHIGRGTTFTLNTGAKLPALGFGTFQDPDAQEEA